MVLILKNDLVQGFPYVFTKFLSRKSVPEVIKHFSCSTKHEILNAHKYENIKTFIILQA